MFHMGDDLPHVYGPSKIGVFTLAWRDSWGLFENRVPPPKMIVSHHFPYQSGHDYIEFFSVIIYIVRI